MRDPSHPRLSFREFINEVTQTPSRDLFKAISRQVRQGSARTQGFFWVSELADEFNCRPAQVHGIITRITHEVETQYRIVLAYDTAVHTAGVSGRNAFGHQGRATSTYAPARVTWRYLGKR